VARSRESPRDDAGATSRRVLSREIDLVGFAPRVTEVNIRQASAVRRPLGGFERIIFSQAPERRGNFQPNWHVDIQ
jgi:hypothetical protein